MKTSDRNAKYSEFMRGLFARAKQDVEINIEPAVESHLKRVFLCPVRGFREILLVIALTKLIEPSYNAYTDFYSCNPRAVYEGPIRSELDKAGVPRGKSGPLNVAKATKGINETWAAQRRPIDVAASTVYLVKRINEAKALELEQITIKMHRLLLANARQLELYRVVSDAKIGTERIISIIRSLIDNVPDRGNTPQKICGFILNAYHHAIKSPIVIEGLEDEACTTNTTSKKPGDFTEFNSDGTVLKTYEVSVKPIDSNRLRDAWESVNAYNKLAQKGIEEVTCLCRIEDALPLIKVQQSDLVIGSMLFNGVVFRFVNIFSWIELMVYSMLNDKAREEVISQLGAYIGQKDTSEPVKAHWKKLMEFAG